MTTTATFRPLDAPLLHAGMPQVWPVIHHLNAALSMEQAQLAAQAGATGIMLISHHGADHELPLLGTQIQLQTRADGHPLLVGLNLLTVAHAPDALRVVLAAGLDALWLDAPGLDSRGLQPQGALLARLLQDQPPARRPLVFAGVGFKYQPHEAEPASAADLARSMGFIPTTSGTATGHPPSADKLASMCGTGGAPLAVASGITVDNVQQLGPFLTHFLVATGISLDEHHFDAARLGSLVARVRALGNRPEVSPRQCDLDELLAAQR